jgi:chromosome segregation ATPase
VTKQEQFDSLQTRQSEFESARSELELLQNRTKELELQLSEANERNAILEDATQQRGRGLGLGVPSNVSRSPSRHNSTTQTAEEVQRLLAEADAKAEAKMSDLRFRIRTLESERNELEEEWAQKVQERVREVERVRRGVLEKENEVNEEKRRYMELEAKLAAAEESRRVVEREVKALKARMEEDQEGVIAAEDAEVRFEFSV